MYVSINAQILFTYLTPFMATLALHLRANIIFDDRQLILWASQRLGRATCSPRNQCKDCQNAPKTTQACKKTFPRRSQDRLKHFKGCQNSHKIFKKRAGDASPDANALPRRPPSASLERIAARAPPRLLQVSPRTGIVARQRLPFNDACNLEVEA